MANGANGSLWKTVAMFLAGAMLSAAAGYATLGWRMSSLAERMAGVEAKVEILIDKF